MSACLHLTLHFLQVPGGHGGDEGAGEPGPRQSPPAQGRLCHGVPVFGPGHRDRWTEVQAWRQDLPTLGVLPCRSLCPLTAKCRAQVQQVPAQEPWGPRRPHPPRLPSASQHSQLQVWKGQVPETAARWELGCEPPRRQAGRVWGASVLQMSQPSRGSERAESWSSQSPGGGLVISCTTGPGRASHLHSPPPTHTGTRVHTRTQVRTPAQAYAQKSEDTRTHMPSSSSIGEWFPGQNLIPPGVSGQNPHCLFQEPGDKGFLTPWERGALSPSRC